jgi:hypothetical protein
LKTVVPGIKGVRSRFYCAFGASSYLVKRISQADFGAWHSRSKLTISLRSLSPLWQFPIFLNFLLDFGAECCIIVNKMNTEYKIQETDGQMINDE